MSYSPPLMEVFMKYTGDYYKDVGGIANLGVVFTQFTHLYRSYMASDNFVPSPSMRNLFGNSSIPSMYLEKRYEEGVEKSFANLDSLPFHIGRVVDVIHKELIGTMRNIEFVTTKPDEVISHKMANQKVSETFRRTKLFVPEYKEKLEFGEARISFLADILNDVALDCMPDKIPELEFRLTNKKTGVGIPPVRIPNRIIKIDDDNQYLGSSGILYQIPLALLCWGLNKAKQGKILADDASYFIISFSGTQQALTDSMALLFGDLEKKLPEGETIDEYLFIDGRKITNTIREEAHHLQALYAASRAAAQIDIMKICYFLMTPAGLKPDEFSFKKEFLGRDVSLLLEGTAMGYGTLETVSRENLMAHRLIFGKFYGSDFANTITTLAKLSENISKLDNPDEIASILTSNTLVFTDCLRRAEMARKFLDDDSVDYLTSGLGLVIRNFTPALDIPKSTLTRW